jgi:hypothetical protein
MGKQDAVHPHNGIFKDKKEWNTDTCTWINLKTIMPSKPVPRNLSNWAENLHPYQNLTEILMAALITIAQIQKQPRCPSVDEKIKCYIYTMEYYSAI